MKHTSCGILTQFRNWLRVPELMWLDLFIHGQLLEYLLQVFGRDVPNGGRVCCYHGDTPCSCSTTLLVFVFFVLLLLHVYRGRETDKSPCNTVEYTEHRRKSAGTKALRKKLCYYWANQKCRSYLGHLWWLSFMGKNLHKLLENFDKIFINHEPQLINNMEMWLKTKVDVGGRGLVTSTVCFMVHNRSLFFPVFQSNKNKNGSKQH